MSRRKKGRGGKAPQLVHYLNPPACGKSGRNRRVRTTDDRDAVTCPACRMTKAYMGDDWKWRAS